MKKIFYKLFKKNKKGKNEAPKKASSKSRKELIPVDRLPYYKSHLTTVKYVAKKYNMTKEDAFLVMDDAKQKYGITYTNFASKDMMKNPTPETFLKEKERRDAQRASYLRKISDVTGWTLEKADEETARIERVFKIGIRKYYDKQLYLLDDDGIANLKKEWSREAKERVEFVKEKTDWSESKIKAHMKTCNLAFGIDPEHYMVFKAWELTDEQLAEYSTLRDSRSLAHKYNKGISVLSDKEKFNRTFGDYTQRKFWVNRDSSYEEFLAFTEGLDSIFCKPLDLCSGTGAEKIKLDGDLRMLYDDLMNRPKMLVEECVKQHPKMSGVYDGSVNTVRMVTLFKDEKCIRLCSFVRFGRNGATDNFGAGGVLAAVDEETGIIITDAVDLKGEVYKKHPISGVEFKGFQIPHWDKVLEITENAIQVVDSINYVGWDVAICEDKAVIIEGNSLPGLLAYQSAFAAEKKGQKYRFLPYMK